MCFRYGREYAEPYLGHSIGPVTGYGVISYSNISLCSTHSWALFDNGMNRSIDSQIGLKRAELYVGHKDCVIDLI